MRILIVGATGQIGTALVSALSKTEHQIAILVREKAKPVFQKDIRVIRHAEFTFSAFLEALTDVDHVVYGIGLPEQYSRDISIFDRVNYGLLRTFLDALRQSTTRSLTYISTYQVFRDNKRIIFETDQIADEGEMTPYFKAMTKAYRLAAAFASEHGVKLTTIHPAAVYGGLSTGDGITSYIDNLLDKKYWKIPFIVNGKFPVVHADSLADAIIKSLSAPQGAYIVTDQVTSLQEIALTVNKHRESYVPIKMPVWVARIGISVLEVFARIFNVKPIMAKVQLKFITSGLDPRADKSRDKLRWTPRSLDEGIKRYLSR